MRNECVLSPCPLLKERGSSAQRLALVCGPSLLREVRKVLICGLASRYTVLSLAFSTLPNPLLKERESTPRSQALRGSSLSREARRVF